MRTKAEFVRGHTRKNKIQKDGLSREFGSRRRPSESDVGGKVPRGYEEIIPNLAVVLFAPAMDVKPDESQSSDLLDREWYGIVEIKFSKISLTFARRLSVV